jgi:hypothetical protein
MRALLAGALLSLAACTLMFGDEKDPLRVRDGCLVGGCSSQICGDRDDDLGSTCEWREEYACYRTATCARQADGACGWTPTPALLACLESR